MSNKLKYQYSKVAAILKNYKEILRMQGVLNDGNTKGFTDKQVEVQLDTIKRKVQQVKSEVVGLMADIGQNGGFDSLKWLAKQFRDITVGIRKMNEEMNNGGTNALTLAKYLGYVVAGVAGIKLLSAAMSKLVSNVARAREAFAQTKDYRKGEPGKLFGNWFTDSKAEGKAKGAEIAASFDTGKHTAATKADTAALQENSAAIKGNTIAETQNAGATQGDTAAKIGNAGASVKEAAGDTAEAGAKTRATIATRAHTVATQVGTVAMRTATVATRTLNVALSALGGPVGIASVLLVTLGADLLYSASAEGELATKAQDATEALHDQGEKIQQDLDQLKRRDSTVESLAEAYNKIKGSMSEAGEGTEAYKKKQEQLKDMEETLATMLHRNAEEFIDDTGVKMDKVKEYSEADTNAQIEKQKQTVATAKADVEATKSQITAIKTRIAGLKAEIAKVEEAGNAWEWYSRVLNNAKFDRAKTLKEQGTNLLSMVNNYHEGDGVMSWINDKWVDMYGGQDKVKEMASNLWNQGNAIEVEAIAEAKDAGNAEALQTVLAKYTSQAKDLEETLAKQEYELDNQSVALGTMEADANKSQNGNEYTSEVDTNNYGKERQNKGGHTKKPKADEVLTDELSLAIRAAANSEIAKQYGFDEALLRAIAARESGGDSAIAQYNADGSLLEDYMGSGHFGMFQVTQTDADRFGTGDIANPLNNAMTAVKVLAEKMDAAGGNLNLALKYYSGGDPDYAGKIMANKTAQLASFSFSNDDFGGYTSFNDDVLTAMRGLLGQPYGGSSWHDETVKVCTTLIQRALADAGVDTDTVDNLTGNANLWSGAAGVAFHPYSEIQSGAYQVRPGDIGLTNIDESGHAGHVVMIGENGQGYYAAAGSGRLSAYYDTNWETAFGSSGIEGVISLNELTGTPYTQSIAGRRKKPKSIHDWTPNVYEEIMYKQRLAEEAATREELSGKYKDFFEGGPFGENAAKLAVAKLKLESAKLTKHLIDISQQSTADDIKSYLANHKEIEEELQKKGKTWADLVPAEKRAMANLAGDDSFKKLVDNEEKFRQKCEETTNEIKQQKMALAEAMGYMNSMERNKYMAKDILEDYEMNHPDGGSAFSKARAYDAARPYYEDNLRIAQGHYADAKASSVKDTSDKLAEVEEAENKLKELEEKLREGTESGQSVEGLTQDIEKQRMRLVGLKGELQSLTSVGNKAFQDAKKDLQDAQKEMDEVNRKSDGLRKGIHDMCVDINKKLADGFVKAFSAVLEEGKSFKEAMKDIFNDIGKFALETLLQIGVQWAFKQMGMAGFSGGGGIMGRATGGNIPGFATGGQPGGAIRGAGTGTSDDILAYVADKDRFVYLSDGEYVMTAEATRRIGKGNLDRMNYGHYATGGSLNPTPYVPQLSPSVTKRAKSIDRSNPNARMEELMQQQTDLLRGMGKDGSNGGLVVLNTQASSQDVLKALAENPRAVQAILGGQRRKGFR